MVCGCLSLGGRVCVWTSGLGGVCCCRSGVCCCCWDCLGVRLGDVLS